MHRFELWLEDYAAMVFILLFMALIAATAWQAYEIHEGNVAGVLMMEAMAHHSET